MMWRVWTLLSCLILVILPYIRAQVPVSSSLSGDGRVSRHLLGVTLDRVNLRATPSPTPTPTPSTRPIKQFNIDIDRVHGHVAPTSAPKSTIFGKKKKRPNLQKLRLDDMDMDADVHQILAGAPLADDKAKKTPIIEQKAASKNEKSSTPSPTAAPTTDAPTEPPTDAPTEHPAEPSAEPSDTEIEAAAHEEEVEEETSHKKKVRKTHRHEEQGHESEEEPSKSHHDSEEGETSQKTKQHDDKQESSSHHLLPSDNTHVSNSAANLPLIQHSAIPFEIIKPNDKILEKLKLIRQQLDNKEGAQEQQQDEKINKKKINKQQVEEMREQETKANKKRPDESHDEEEETPSKRKQQNKTRQQEEVHEKASTHQEDSSTRKATKKEKSPIDARRQADAAKKWSWRTNKDTTPTPLPQKQAAVQSDHVDKIVASLAQDFAKHLEEEAAAGHDVSHITNKQTSSTPTIRSHVPPIHSDNLSHHDYVDPDKVHFAQNIEAWKKPPAPPQPKITDAGAVVQEPDGTIHLKGQEPSAEGGPAGIDLGLP